MERKISLGRFERPEAEWVGRNRRALYKRFSEKKIQAHECQGQAMRDKNTSYMKLFTTSKMGRVRGITVCKEIFTKLFLKPITGLGAQS